MKWWQFIKIKKICGSALTHMRETLSVWPHHKVNSLTVGGCIGGGRFFFVVVVGIVVIVIVVMAAGTAVMVFKLAIVISI